MTMRFRIFISILFIGMAAQAGAQVTGGQYAFEYLRLSQSPHVSALGGISIADPASDISLVAENPAMMRPGLHNELELNYNAYYAGISIANLHYGYYVPRLNTSFFLGVQYLNYGNITQTDDVGNVYGSFHANDYALTLGASRQYLEHWRYGADVKWAHSSLGTWNASAALVDVGVNYYDTSTLWDFGVTAKNMGVMVKRYDPGATAEPIPFDLQLGVSHKFRHMPLRLIATVHHLYEWDVRYNNPADLTTTNALGKADTSTDKGSHFADKLFRHFIFAGELSLGKHLLLTASYNFLHRKELALSTQPGLTGFAFGLGLNFNKLKIHWASSYYHSSGPSYEFGLTLALDKLTGLGANGEKINWSNQYPDW